MQRNDVSATVLQRFVCVKCTRDVRTDTAISNQRETYSVGVPARGSLSWLSSVLSSRSSQWKLRPLIHRPTVGHVQRRAIISVIRRHAAPSRRRDKRGVAGPRCAAPEGTTTPTRGGRGRQPLPPVRLSVFPIVPSYRARPPRIYVRSIGTACRITTSSV